MRFKRRRSLVPRIRQRPNQEDAAPLKGQLWTRSERNLKEPDVHPLRRALAAVVAAGEIALLGWLWFGPALDIRSVDTTGAHHLTSSQVAAAAGLNGGGSVGGNETINMNVGGTATTTGDATFAITGNDPSGSAAINFNGGDYEVGGNFRSTIDGNGTIAFNSTTVNANTLKAGVFGPNGTIMIGSGPLSANTLMRLYATGSSGTIDFTASVTLTLNSATTAIILAANKITIDQNVVVTIVGSFPASVYANIANYQGWGGTGGSNTGTFAGNGATTSALGGQPGFDDPPPSATSANTSTASASTKTQSSSTTSTTVASSSRITGATRGTRQSPSQNDVSTLATRTLTSAKTTTATSRTINVSDSGQLLSLLDSATAGPSGKIAIPASKSGGNPQNSSRSSPAGNLKPDRVSAEIQRSAKTTSIDRAQLSLR